MGYSWTPINKGDIIRASHFNEIKTHLEELYQDLELDAPNWTYFPVSVGEVILKDHIQELRDKTDYADDMNYCRAYDSGYEDSVENGEEIGDYGTHNKTYDNNVETGHRNYHDKNVDGTDHYEDRSGADTYERVTHYSDYYATYYEGNKSDYDSVLYLSDYPNDHEAKYISEKDADNSSYNDEDR